MNARKAGCACLSRLESAPARQMGPLILRTLSEGQIPGAGIFHVRLPPGARHEMLYHRRTREWFIVIKGRGRGVIDGKRVVFKPGVIVYIEPGVPHQMMTAGSAMEALVVFSPPMKLSGKDMDIHFVKS